MPNEPDRIINLGAEAPRLPEVHHLIILDASGSMNDFKSVTIAGVNKQLQTAQAADELKETRNFVTLVSFNQSSTYLRNNEQASGCALMNAVEYQTIGSTALYDTIVEVITNFEQNVLGQKAKSDNTKILITIFTDGLNNLQLKYSKEQAAETLTRVQQLGWAVTYVGANQNVSEVADLLNIPLGNTMQYTANNAGYTSAFDTMASSRMMYCRSVSRSIDANESLRASTVASADSSGFTRSFFSTTGNVTTPSPTAKVDAAIAELEALKNVAI